MKYPKKYIVNTQTTTKNTFAFNFLELLHKKKAKVGQNRFLKKFTPVLKILY